MKKITPLGENVLIKIAELEKITKSGIILPSQKEAEKPQQGEVIAIGESKKISPKIKKGVKVIFEKYEGSEIESGKENFLIIKSNSILAVIE